jgi:site-specific DNA-cytosine methylase
MTLSVTDVFCGVGGSSHGAQLAGFWAECQGVCGV